MIPYSASPIAETEGPSPPEPAEVSESAGPKGKKRIKNPERLSADEYHKHVIAKIGHSWPLCMVEVIRLFPMPDNTLLLKVPLSMVPNFYDIAEKMAKSFKWNGEALSCRVIYRLSYIRGRAVINFEEDFDQKRLFKEFKAAEEGSSTPNIEGLIKNEMQRHFDALRGQIGDLGDVRTPQRTNLGSLPDPGVAIAALPEHIEPSVAAPAAVSPAPVATPTPQEPPQPIPDLPNPEVPVQRIVLIDPPPPRPRNVESFSPVGEVPVVREPPVAEPVPIAEASPESASPPTPRQETTNTRPRPSQRRLNAQETRRMDQKPIMDPESRDYDPDKDPRFDSSSDLYDERTDPDSDLYDARFDPLSDEYDPSLDKYSSKYVPAWRRNRRRGSPSSRGRTSGRAQEEPVAAATPAKSEAERIIEMQTRMMQEEREKRQREHEQAIERMKQETAALNAKVAADAERARIDFEREKERIRQETENRKIEQQQLLEREKMEHQTRLKQLEIEEARRKYEADKEEARRKDEAAKEEARRKEEAAREEARRKEEAAREEARRAEDRRFQQEMLNTMKGQGSKSELDQYLELEEKLARVRKLRGEDSSGPKGSKPEEENGEELAPGVPAPKTVDMGTWRGVTTKTKEGDTVVDVNPLKTWHVNLDKIGGMVKNITDKIEGYMEKNSDVATEKAKNELIKERNRLLEEEAAIKAKIAEAEAKKTRQEDEKFRTSRPQPKVNPAVSQMVSQFAHVQDPGTSKPKVNASELIRKGTQAMAKSSAEPTARPAEQPAPKVEQPSTADPPEETFEEAAAEPEETEEERQERLRKELLGE